jgi:MSHA biogenesis protein MshO
VYLVRALRSCPRAASRSRGFSLVELVVVIVITGVIASVVGLFITGPIQGFIDQARRAELVDAAQLALTRMGRDVRGALPNSVRISGGALELLATIDGDRYRVEAPGADNDRLAVGSNDTFFNTLAPLSLPGGASTATASVAIYPLQQTGANPYNVADGVMTASHRFPFDSPTRRVFLVSGPVTYQCSPPQLLRYDGYAVSAVQPVPPAVTPVVITGNVQSCAFAFEPGTGQRNAVVSLSVSLAANGVTDERVRLIRQIHIGNVP